MGFEECYKKGAVTAMRVIKNQIAELRVQIATGEKVYEMIELLDLLDKECDDVTACWGDE